VLTEQIQTYIGQRLNAKLEAIDKELVKESITESQRDKLLEDRNTLSEEYVPREWLERAAKRASQINFVTHAPKFTHSDSKASGALCVDQPKDKNELVVTASLVTPELDIVGNAAALDVASFLKLKDTDGRSLADYLRLGDASPLAQFANSDSELNQWLNGFAQALENPKVQSHALAKQLFFPVADSYHLLSPLYASSLSQTLTHRIRHQLFSENAKDARDARKNNQPSDLPIVSFPKLGIVEYGGSKPQNISKLNSERGGRGYLLDCQPPTWRFMGKLPQTSLQFWRQLERITWLTLQELREYLGKHQNSPAVRRIKDPINEQVNAIVESFFRLTANIRLLGQEQGGSSSWSDQMEFTPALALLLNPERAELDAEFREVRELKEWPGEIGKEFGIWLNQQLKTDDLNFGDTERNHWAKIIKNTVSRLRDDLHYFQENV